MEGCKAGDAAQWPEELKDCRFVVVDNAPKRVACLKPVLFGDGYDVTLYIPRATAASLMDKAMVLIGDLDRCRNISECATCSYYLGEDVDHCMMRFSERLEELHDEIKQKLLA